VASKATMQIFRAAEGRVLPDETGDVGMELLPMSQSTQDGFARLIDAGKTQQEAIAARPTADLDPVWARGLFTGPMFTRIAYEGLANHRATGGHPS